MDPILSQMLDFDPDLVRKSKQIIFIFTLPILIFFSHQFLQLDDIDRKFHGEFYSVGSCFSRGQNPDPFSSRGSDPDPGFPRGSDVDPFFFFSRVGPG